MLTMPSTVKVYMAMEPYDLRRGVDGLSAAARSVMGVNPLSGHLFVFLNRRGDKVKVLMWDRTGFCILYKRLECGRFYAPKVPSVGAPHVELEAAELSLMLEGIELQGAKRHARWHAPANATAP